MLTFAVSIVAFVFVTIGLSGVIWLVTERIEQKRYAAAAEKWRADAYRKYPARGYTPGELPSIPIESPEATSFFIDRAEWHNEGSHIYHEEPQAEATSQADFDVVSDDGGDD